MSHFFDPNREHREFNNYLNIILKNQFYILIFIKAETYNLCIKNYLLNFNARH